jgi:hypothetical protein
MVTSNPRFVDFQLAALVANVVLTRCRQRQLAKEDSRCQKKSDMTAALRRDEAVK